MPNCIQLYPVNSNQPATFQAIDDEMRKHFNAPADPDNWYHGWYNYVAFLLAFGKTYQSLRQDMDEECLTKPIESDAWKWAAKMRDIIDWMEARYRPNCWAEIGRR